MNILLSIKKWLEAGGSRRKWIAGLFLLSFIITGILFISGGSSSSMNATEPTPLYFAGVIAKLIAVLFLIIGGAILVRRWQIKNGFNRTGKRLNVVETVRLSPKQAIHLVRVGNQHLLIGATDQSISMLSTIDLPASDQPSQANDPSRNENSLGAGQPQTSFQELLQSFTSSQEEASQDKRGNP
jgi:flagellar biosynthetic protein FliO